MDLPSFPLFDGDAIWYLAGLSIVLTALVAGVRALHLAARKRRILGARVAASLADARDGELVIVRGKARGERFVATELTKKDALWTRFIVRGEFARPGLLRVRTVLREVKAEAFVVEDASGRVEVASADKAHVVVAPERVDQSYTNEDAVPEPRVLAFFRARPEFEALEGDKVVQAVRTFEEAILNGDEVAVVGVAHRTGPNDLRITPGRDGLYIIQGDVHALAQNGTLWRETPDA